MSTDPVAEYQAAIGRYCRADQEARATFALLKTASYAIRNPGVAVFLFGDAAPTVSTNADGGPGPTEAPMWPSSKHLQAMVNEWRAARHGVSSAWAAMPAERRLGLFRPEHVFSPPFGD